MTLIIRIPILTIIALSFFVVATSPAALIPEESDAFNGKTAPAFSFETINGDQFSSQNFAGHSAFY
jgi:hypothetical protein